MCIAVTAAAAPPEMPHTVTHVLGVGSCDAWRGGREQGARAVLDCACLCQAAQSLEESVGGTHALAGKGQAALLARSILVLPATACALAAEDASQQEGGQPQRRGHPPVLDHRGAAETLSDRQTDRHARTHGGGEEYLGPQLGIRNLLMAGRPTLHPPEPACAVVPAAAPTRPSSGRRRAAEAIGAPLSLLCVPEERGCQEGLGR